MSSSAIKSSKSSAILFNTHLPYRKRYSMWTIYWKFIGCSRNSSRVAKTNGKTMVTPCKVYRTRSWSKRYYILTKQSLRYKFMRTLAISSINYIAFSTHAEVFRPVWRNASCIYEWKQRQTLTEAIQKNARQRMQF